MTERKLRVAAYCRVSTDKDDQANSLISQKRYFTEYIGNRQEWLLIDIYCDDGYSGTQTRKRISFNAMIEKAMEGGIDLILTKEVCRFARNTVDTLYYTRKLREKGVGVIFTIDNIDTRDSDGELRLTLMASMAQEESRKTSERVKWGQKRRMEQGIVFGRDLLGYTVRGGILAVNEEEAPVVRAIFHKYTNEGKGVHVIAKELLEEGMCPKQAAFWSDTTILRVLRNEKYVGDLCQKKTCTPDYLTHVKKYNHGEEETIYLKDHHEPLIERELWERTQEKLARRSAAKRKSRTYVEKEGKEEKEAMEEKGEKEGEAKEIMEAKAGLGTRYWCSGKIYCGLCGRRFVSRTKRLKSGGMYRAWRCYAAASHGTVRILESGQKTGCDNQSVNERSLLACLSYCVKKTAVQRDGLRADVIQELQALRFEGAKCDAEKIQSRMDALDHKKKKAIDLMVEGAISQEDLKEQLQWYEERTGRLSGQLEELCRTRDAFSWYGKDFQRAEGILDGIMSFDESNVELYGEILDKIVIYPGNRVLLWLKKIPFGIYLTFAAHGREEAYTTEILDMEIEEKV